MKFKWCSLCDLPFIPTRRNQIHCDSFHKIISSNQPIPYQLTDKGWRNNSK